MTNQEIIEAGQLIHDEEAVGGNTSERVGGAIKGIGQNLEEQSEDLADVNRRLANEAETRANEDTSIRQALQLETTTRIEKDAQEKINRQDADAALQQAIDNEETARQTAYTSLQQAISNEVAARQTAVQTERGLREDADATLLGLIRAVTLSLADYYLKTETYNKTEVNALIDAINSFEYVAVPQLPSPSASTMNKIYLVPSPHSEDENVKDEFITTKTGGTYDWEQIGSTAVDLSGYSTTAEMTAAINGALATALAGYYTKQEVAQLLSSKQDAIEDLQQIRTGAAAGATALQEEDIEEMTDSEPTPESDKLINSGGVYSAISRLLPSITTKGLDIALSTVGYYDENMNIQSLSTWRCGEIDLVDCVGIFIDVKCDGNVAYCFLVDANYNILRQWNNLDINEYLLLASYPSAAKILISCRSSYTSHVNKLYDRVDETKAAIDNELSGTISSFVAKSWKLHNKMYIDLHGNIVGNGVPTNNTAISFFKDNRNVWWLEATFDRNNANYINAGLILAENTMGKVFRMMKATYRPTSTAAATTVDFYSHPNGSFVELKRILSSAEQAYKGDTCQLIMARSGNVCAGYLNGTFYGHQKFLRLNGKTNTMFGGVLMSADNKARDISFGMRPTPYAHFSVDDVGLLMKVIATDTPASIFENGTFAFLKNMHEKYGACFTLNLFYSITVDGNEWTLASFPNTYKDELTANSSWLKFAFHGGDGTITYNSEDNNPSAITAYNNTMNAIASFAGEASIDYMPRVTYYSGNKTLFNALRDTGNFWGCLTADDTRVDNSSLNEAERECVNVSSDYIDFANMLYYVRTIGRIDNYAVSGDNTDTSLIEAKVKADLNDNGSNNIFEYFCHAMTSGSGGVPTVRRNLIEAALKLLVANQIRMDFAMNNMPF